MLVAQLFLCSFGIAAVHQVLSQPIQLVIDGVTLTPQDVIAAVNGRKTLPRNPPGWAACERNCPQSQMDPVCDSWGQTQPNSCFFDMVQCRVRSMTLSIDLGYRGRCIDSPSSNNFYSDLSNFMNSNGMSGGIITNSQTQPIIKLALGNVSPLSAYSQMSSNDYGSNRPLLDYAQPGYNAYSAACERACPTTIDITCDNEGRVYNNRCYFEVAYCHAQRETGRFLRTVPCQGGVSTAGSFSSTLLSDTVGSSNFASRIAPVSNFLQGGMGGGIFGWNNRGLMCPERCPTNYDPVCNNLGIQLTNFCFFRMATCYLQSTLHLTVYRAQCGTLSYNSNCQQSCSQTEFNPICDQNGIQYTNDCYYRVAQCYVLEKGLDLMQTACGTGMIRDATGVENCEKICPNTRSSSPYCDDQGRQYQNFCYFSVAQCRAKQMGMNLVVSPCISPNSPTDLFSNAMNFGSVATGPIGSNRNIFVPNTNTFDNCNTQEDCGNRGYQPVCDSQGVTHVNECFFRKVQCNRQRVGGLLTIASYTACSSTGFNDNLFPPIPVAQAQSNPNLGGIFPQIPNIRDFNPQFGPQVGCKTVRDISTNTCTSCVPPANSFSCSSGSNCVCGTNCVTYCSQCDLERDACQMRTLATVCSRPCDYCDRCRPVG